IFAGISVLGGSVNIGTSSGNTVGSASATGAITTTSTVTGTVTDGIFATSTGTLNIPNNNVGGITASSATAAIGFVVRGIETAGTGGNVTLSGNTVGSTTTADSIQVGISGTTTAITSFAGLLNAATGTITITNNTIQNDSLFGTGNNIFLGISNTGGTGTINITNNSILNGSSRANASANSDGIVSSAAAATVNLNNNTIRGMTWNGTSGVFRGIEQSGAVTAAININDNKLGDATASLMNYTAVNTALLTGIISSAGASGVAVSIQRNDFRVSYAFGTTNGNDYINLSGGTPLSEIIKDNTFTGINVNTTGAITLIRTGAALAANGTQTITNNSIVGSLTKGPSTGASGGPLTGINYPIAGSPATSTLTNSNNNFSNITVAGTSAAAVSVTCVQNDDVGPKIIQNNVCSNWTGAFANFTGIRISNGNATVSNNTVTNL